MTKKEQIVDGLTVCSQNPLDSKRYKLTLGEVTDYGKEAVRAYTYYDGLQVYCNEDGKIYHWKEVGTLSEDKYRTVGEPFTYPENIHANGIDYSNRTFQFHLSIDDKDDIDMMIDIKVERKFEKVELDTQYSPDGSTNWKNEYTPDVSKWMRVKINTNDAWSSAFKITGEQGPQGIQGPYGPQGIKGEDGIDGVDGKDGKNGIDGKDGKDGAQGLQGVRGPQGPTGIQGEQGAQGLPGKDGLPGEKGKQGDKGEVGPQGIQGVAGPQGEKGPKGDKGDKGDTGKGEQGIQGPVGPKGADGVKGDKGDPGKNGEPGPKGDPGETGKSAYQIWLDEGNTGTEEDFLTSLKGSKGDKGDTGAPGKDGTDATLNLEDIVGNGLTIQDDKLTLGGVYLDSPVLAQAGIEPFFFKGHIPFQDVIVKQGGVDTSLAMNVSLGDNMTVSQFSGEELEFPLATVNVVKSVEQSQASIMLSAYETLSEVSAVTVNLNGIDLSSNKPITINHMYNMVKKVNEQRADKDGNIVLPFKTINGNNIQGIGDITIETETQELKTINGETLIGKGNIVIEKGITNIKTVNGQTLVGTGNIDIDLSLPNEIKKIETDTVTDPLKRPIEKQYLLSYDKIIASTKGYDSRYRKDFINKGVTLTPEEGIKISNLETGKIESTVELSKKGLDIKHMTLTEQGGIGEYFELKLNNIDGLETSLGEGVDTKSLSVNYNNLRIRNGSNTFDASLSDKKVTLGIDDEKLELTTKSIKLHDTVTGEPVTITVENGVLKIV